jgi:chromodomain-helicase-DNA-binding protein 1
VSTYNEDDDDIFNDEEDMLTPNYWPTGPDENLPAIDLVLDHRLREDTSESFLSCLVCFEANL